MTGTIRQAYSGDMDGIMEIWLEGNLLAHSFLPEEYWKSNQQLVRERYLPLSHNLVCEWEAAPAGFISVLEDGFIGALFVRQSQQGKGLGKKLLDHCKGLHTRLSLAVYVENRQAVGFYKSQGFQVQSQGPNEDSGCEEYLMVWEKEM